MEIEQLNGLARELLKINGTSGIYLHGSNRDLNKPESDIDVVLVGKYDSLRGKKPPEDFTNTVEEIFQRLAIPIGNKSGQVHVSYVKKSDFDDSPAMYWGNSPASFIDGVRKGQKLPKES